MRLGLATALESASGISEAGEGAASMLSRGNPAEKARTLSASARNGLYAGYSAHRARGNDDAKPRRFPRPRSRERSRADRSRTSRGFRRACAGWWRIGKEPCTPIAKEHIVRISTAQRQSIPQATRQSFGEDARVWLFGSRTDDARQRRRFGLVRGDEPRPFVDDGVALQNNRRKPGSACRSGSQ